MLAIKATMKTEMNTTTVGVTFLRVLGDSEILVEFP